MQYEVHIDARAVVHTIAEIEQGAPQRMFMARTFTDAWAIGNAVRFASGLPMIAKLRKPTWPGCVTLHSPTDPDACIVVKIVRRSEV